MKTRIVAFTVALLGLATIELFASGRAGIYGIIDRVVFEPTAISAERIQLWGAFAIVERGQTAGNGGTEVQGQVYTNFLHQKPTRGYLYFRLPVDRANIENARREWADLASVSGTRQAVAFGYWDRFRGDKLMRIRGDGAKPEDPDIYYTDVGVAKLGTAGSHARIVADLLKLMER